MFLKDSKCNGIYNTEKGKPKSRNQTHSTNLRKCKWRHNWQYMNLVSPRKTGRGKKEELLHPISEGFSEEVNFDSKRMELGRALTTGQGQLMGCPTPPHPGALQGNGNGRRKATSKVLRLPTTAPSHSKATSATSAVVSKSGRKEGLSEKSHKMKPSEPQRIWGEPAVGGCPLVPWPPLHGAVPRRCLSVAFPLQLALCKKHAHVSLRGLEGGCV